MTFEVTKQMPSFRILGLPYKLPFAVCWEDWRMTWQEETGFVQDSQPLLSWQQAWAGYRKPKRLADPSKEMTYVHLPPCGSGVTLRGWGFKSSHKHSPAFAAFPADWAGLVSPQRPPASSRAAPPPGECSRGQPGKRELGGGCGCTNTRAGWINQFWLLASP